jgi:hypothetical protein
MAWKDTYSQYTDSLYCSPVNNTGLDPLQGFDFFVWVQDVCTGKVAWFGLFQSLTLSIRDATETYLELGQRLPIHLNGEIQIAWVLEQGLVDMNFVERAFGTSCLRRDMYITRGPRFQISFDANAQELENFNTGNVVGKLDRGNTGGQGTGGTGLISRQGSDEYFSFPEAAYATRNGGPDAGKKGPTAVGRYDVLRCKLDSISIGIMPGRRVVAVRWEGVAEGICFVPTSVQTFKTDRARLGNASSGNFVNGIDFANGAPGALTTMTAGASQ